MSYAAQNIIAEDVVQGLIVIIREGLNIKDDLELRIVVPQHLHSLYTEPKYRYISKRISDEATFFWAEDPVTGEVHYMVQTPNTTGFGGARQKLPMLDGTEVEVHGAWSSRASVLNGLGFKPCKEVNIQSRWNMASNMTIERINDLIGELGYVAVPKRSGQEIKYKIISHAALDDLVYSTACELDSPNSPDFTNVQKSVAKSLGIEDYE